jgi:hypothetical protein
MKVPARHYLKALQQPERLHDPTTKPDRQRFFTRRFDGGIRLDVNVGFYDGYTTYGGTIRRDTPEDRSTAFQIMYKPAALIGAKGHFVGRAHSNLLFCDGVMFDSGAQDSAITSFMLCVRQAVAILRAEKFAGL